MPKIANTSARFGSSRGLAFGNAPPFSARVSSAAEHYLGLEFINRQVEMW